MDYLQFLQSVELMTGLDREGARQAAEATLTTRAAPPSRQASTSGRCSGPSRRTSRRSTGSATGSHPTTRTVRLGSPATTAGATRRWRCRGPRGRAAVSPGWCRATTGLLAVAAGLSRSGCSRACALAERSPAALPPWGRLFSQLHLNWVQPRSQGAADRVIAADRPFAATAPRSGPAEDGDSA
jgi:hypothetical protein